MNLWNYIQTFICGFEQICFRFSWCLSKTKNELRQAEVDSNLCYQLASLRLHLLAPEATRRGKYF